MGANDDAVASLQGNQGLKDSGGGGVGGGNDSAHNTDGLGNLLGAVSGILLDDAAGLGLLIGVVDILGGVMVLGHLVLYTAHAGLFHSHLCQRNTLEVGSHCSSAEDLVHLLLGVGGEKLLGFAHPGKHSLERFRVVHDLIRQFCVHEMIHPFLFILC